MYEIDIYMRSNKKGCENEDGEIWRNVINEDFEVFVFLYVFSFDCVMCFYI